MKAVISVFKKDIIHLTCDIQHFNRLFNEYEIHMFMLSFFNAYHLQELVHAQFGHLFRTSYPFAYG